MAGPRKSSPWLRKLCGICEKPKAVQGKLRVCERCDLNVIVEAPPK